MHISATSEDPVLALATKGCNVKDFKQYFIFYDLQTNYKQSVLPMFALANTHLT